MHQRYEFILNDQAGLKKYFRFCQLRQYLLSVSTAGVYTISEIKRCSIATGVSYNTLRADLATFIKHGLLERHGKFITLKRLGRAANKLYNLYLQNEDLIHEQINPSLFFTDLVKKALIFQNVLVQARMEASKCDTTSGKRLMKTVRRSETRLGDSMGINLSLGTIARLLGRSKTTAHKYIERMNDATIIKRIKNRKFICDVQDYSKHRNPETFGRLFIQNYKVYQRMQNSYVFN